MPRIPFDRIPDDARVWVFGSDVPLTEDATARLLAAVDEYLSGWQAHGVPLRSAREWRDDRFLAIGVDQSTAGASGCSIDGLYRSIAALEPVLGARLLGGGRVFYRDASGTVHCVDREEFAELAAAGVITRDSPVFDTTVATAAEWRDRFETEVGKSWHGHLVG